MSTHTLPSSFTLEQTLLLQLGVDPRQFMIQTPQNESINMSALNNNQVGTIVNTELTLPSVTSPNSYIRDVLGDGNPKVDHNIIKNMTGQDNTPVRLQEILGHPIEPMSLPSITSPSVGGTNLPSVTSPSVGGTNLPSVTSPLPSINLPSIESLSINSSQ